MNTQGTKRIKHLCPRSFRLPRMKFECPDASAQCAYRQRYTLLGTGDHQTSCCFNHEGSVAGGGLEEARIGKIGLASPADIVQNSANDFRPGVDATVFVKCL